MQLIYTHCYKHHFTIFVYMHLGHFTFFPDYNNYKEVWVISITTPKAYASFVIILTAP